MAKAVHPTVAETHRISQWLERSKVSNAALSGVPVDLADALAAAERVKMSVDELLRLDVSGTLEAERALTLAADIEAQLSSELLPHVASLERAWPKLVALLGDRMPRLGGEAT